jgi:hypothetical protein
MAYLPQPPFFQYQLHNESLFDPTSNISVKRIVFVSEAIGAAVLVHKSSPSEKFFKIARI